MSNVVLNQQHSMSLEDMRALSRVFILSGLFRDQNKNDITEEQAIVKIMAGRELGMEPFTAMQCIDIVLGKISVKPIAIAARIKQSGKYDYKVVKQTDEICTIDFFQNGAKIGESIFTIQDAARMGLSGKDNWRKQPAVMLYNRAMSKGARQACPDAFFGVPVYTREELTDSYEPDALPTPTSVVQPSPRPTAEEESYNKKISKLLKMHEIDTDVFREYLQSVWFIETLKTGVISATEYTGIKAAIERGNEYLKESAIKAHAELVQEEEPTAPEPTEAEKELELV